LDSDLVGLVELVALVGLMVVPGESVIIVGLVELAELELVVGLVVLAVLVVKSV
jgi:hypothetical protein